MCTTLILLGEVYDRHLLTSYQRISDRMINKIDRVTSLMTEHGFDQFYQHILEFQQKWLFAKDGMTTRKDKYEVNLEPITIEQLRKPIIIVLCLNGIAGILFIAEIVVFKWLEWRKRKQLTIDNAAFILVSSLSDSVFYRPSTDFANCRKAAQAEIRAKVSETFFKTMQNCTTQKGNY